MRPPTGKAWLLSWAGKKEIEDRFPWDIFYRKGAEKVKDWNLPEAARNPLFGLPEIPPGKLPDQPFLFLNRYERKHAEIFFGRSYYIRELYHRVTDQKSPPIILLYGQTGVGKSSLLDAGLIPRLEQSHTVCYARRDPQKGLLGTIEKVLHDGLPGKDRGGAAENWRHMESAADKPLVFILDQVEEVFTNPNKELVHEWEDFLEALTAIFGNSAAYPRGKLILGYRKEFHPEIDEKLKNYELDRTPLFMEPLRREDIMDVVTGLTRTKLLRDKYNIEVEEKLPVIIADDLLEGKNTPVVIDEYSDSNRPAQRASRILAAKIDDFKKNKNKKKIFLDEVDLEIVEEGEKWMRAWDHDEEQLVAQSRKRKAHREKAEKWNRNLRIVLVIVIFIFAIFQWRIAVNRSRRSEANRLAAEAERAVEKNPTTALRLAEKAYRLDKNKIVTETLQKIYRENNFYKIIVKLKDSISGAVISPDSNYILTRSASEDKNAYLWDLRERPMKPTLLEGHRYRVIAIAFSPAGQYILTGSKDRTARSWDLQGNRVGIFKGHKDWVYSAGFSADGKYNENRDNFIMVHFNGFNITGFGLFPDH
jgi:hypothetical protein